MPRTIRQQRPAGNRPRVEALEVRALLSLAGAIDPSFVPNDYFPIVPTGFNTSTLIAPAGTALSAVAADGTIVLADSFIEGDTQQGPGFFTIEKLNANGEPDASFGQDGRASFQVGTQDAYAQSLVVQPDGTIDIGGILNTSSFGAAGTVGVIQVTPTGTLDTSFGQGGIASLPTLAPDQNPFQSLTALALAPDGQLVAVGQDINATTGSTSFYAARFNANGTLDDSFGTKGVAVVPVTLNGNTLDQATAVAVESSGEVIVGGYAPNVVNSGTLKFNESVVLGLTSTGALDPSFGGPSAEGQVIISTIPSSPTMIGMRQVVALALQSNGQIVLAETNAKPLEQNGFVGLQPATGDLTRLNADGTIDTTFGTAGTVSFTNGLTPHGLTITPSGQFLVPGSITDPKYVTDTDPALARYNADGTIDPTFGTPETPGLSTYAHPVASFGTQTSIVTTASINSAGQIVLGGSLTTASFGTYATESVNFQVIRALSNSTITRVETEAPADYDGSGMTNLAVYLPSIGAFAYRPTNGSADVFVPFGIAGAGQTIPAPGDYTGVGQTEIAAYLPSQGVYAYRPDDGSADVVVPFGIAGAGQSIPVPGDYFGTGLDDVAVYMPSIGAFGIRNPAGGPDQIIPFGSAGMGQSIPAPADYFGTGQTDLAVYLPSIGAFAIRNPAGGPDQIIPFGIAGAGNSIPIPGDYDGSGKTELAVYFPKLGEFAYRPANGGPDVIVPFGSADGSIPVPGDYTGVGHDEIAVYDPNYGDFAYRPASGPDVIVSFGSAGVGASLPLAAPISANVPPSNPGTVSAMSILSSSVPGGPMAKASVRALARVASSRPAQGESIGNFH